MEQVREDLECQGQDLRTARCGEDCALWGALEMLSKGEGLITAGGLIRVIEEAGEQTQGLLS